MMSAKGLLLVKIYVLLLGAICFLTEAHAQRIATIIANSEYETLGWALDNPARDAALMKASLEEVGFSVEVIIDASEDEMKKAFVRHAERLRTAGTSAVGFFFYAGHGVQSRGINYLIPTDLNAKSEQDIWAQAPRLGLLFELLEDAGNDTNFIVLDACRNNPLPSIHRSVERGLVAEGRVRGTLIAYSTAPGAVAEDGSTNSPFVKALAVYIKQPGLSAESMFRLIATSVEEQTSMRQQPWIESGLRGRDFCFAGCRVPRLVEANDEVLALQEAWESESIEVMKDFLDKFPFSSSRSLLEARIVELSPVKAQERSQAMDADRDITSSGILSSNILSDGLNSPELEPFTLSRVPIGSVQSVNQDFGFVVLQLHQHYPIGTELVIESSTGHKIKVNIARLSASGVHSATLTNHAQLSLLSGGNEVFAD